MYCLARRGSQNMNYELETSEGSMHGNLTAWELSEKKNGKSEAEICKRFRILREDEQICKAQERFLRDKA